MTMDNGQWTKKKTSNVNSQMSIIIGYLYGDLMNIYGDTGNIIALKKRAEWRGIKVTVKNFSTENILKEGDADIFFFGGGQDLQQVLVAKDLGESGKGKIIKSEVERGIPLLSICGGYQLLGEYYQPQSGPRLPGAGLFPAYTVAGEKRMIGNIVISIDNGQWTMDNFKSSNSQMPNAKCQMLLVGFENHSGKTYLRKGVMPLGKVIKGFGNNGEDQTEGCIYKNAIGCYMHGPLLPKNPQLTDWLIKKALEVKYGKVVELKSLDDTLETLAHEKSVQKFR